MADLNLRMNRGQEKGDIVLSTATLSSSGVLSARWDSDAFENTDEVAKHLRLIAQYVRENGIDAPVQFRNIATSYERPRCWLPCDEDTGTALNNLARDDSLDTGAILAATAWDNYDRTARGAAALTSTSDSPAVINEFSPVRNVFGNTVAAGNEADSCFFAALIRYEGALTSSLVEIGATNEAFSVSAVGATNFFFQVAGTSFYSEAFDTDARIFGVAAFAQASAPVPNLSVEWCVIEYTTAGVLVAIHNASEEIAAQVSPDYTAAGGVDIGGTMQFANVGGTSELFGIYYAQMPNGERPGFSDHLTLTEQARGVFDRWLIGDKNIPVEWYRGSV